MPPSAMRLRYNLPSFRRYDRTHSASRAIRSSRLGGGQRARVTARGPNSKRPPSPLGPGWPEDKTVWLLPRG